MHSLFKPVLKPQPIPTSPTAPDPETPLHQFEKYTGFFSDMSDEDDLDSDGKGEGSVSDLDRSNEPVTSFSKDSLPSHKRRRLDVPFWTKRALDVKARMSEWAKALRNINKLMKSPKTQFISGLHGLQACRTLAMQTHICLVCVSKRNSIDASERAAEAHGFAPKWGG